ncbi:hypothetical protein NUW54_g8287 [Trametes sanguinea]|uniref:Uncharacterized protein n=1 Tax=Trametes sanguinea TaxID=158606 RepID=A0ACC1PGY3_9APHY|nr:hypothetical protein NUW54_g8287 [Trametes sanguinea]
MSLDESAHVLPEPLPDQPFIEVSALEAGFLELRMRLFVSGSGPTESKMCPSLSFLLRHSSTKETLVFDLGIRRNLETHPPAVRQLNAGRTVVVPRTVAESLQKGGVDSKDIKTVILSHLHFDQYVSGLTWIRQNADIALHSVGDASLFPRATFILGGDAKEFLAQRSYPTDPDSLCLGNAVPLERTLFLDKEFTRAIGPFPRAYDYFGDGNLYIIVHNIEGAAFRAPKHRSALALLALAPRVHLCASFDHVVGAPLRWSLSELFARKPTAPRPHYVSSYRRGAGTRRPRRERICDGRGGAETRVRVALARPSTLEPYDFELADGRAGDDDLHARVCDLLEDLSELTISRSYCCRSKW